MSTIGSRAVSTRQKKAIAETTQIAAQIATEVSCSHSYCGPSSSTYSSAPRKPAMKIRPHQSKCSSSAKFGWSKSTSASTPMVMPMPGTMLMKNSQCHDIKSVMIAADGRPDGRRQRRDEADDRADDVEFRARKHRVGGGEHGRDHAGAEKSLDRAPQDHLLDRGGEAAEEARDGEAGGRDRKQQPRAERARQEAGQRDRDHFGDQIGGLHPRHFARARRQAGLDFATARPRRSGCPGST